MVKTGGAKAALFELSIAFQRYYMTLQFAVLMSFFLKKTFIPLILKWTRSGGC